MSEHISSARSYFLICAILLGLTVLTVQVAFVDLGAFNTLAALGIAAGKAVLVVLYFMHVRYAPKLIWVVVGSGVLFIGILLSLTLADYMSRGWIT